MGTAKLIDAFEEGGRDFIVVNSVKGGSLLNSMLKMKVTHLPVHEACNMMGQLLKILQSLHAKHIKHAKITIDSVTVIRRRRESDKLYLFDFSQATIVQDQGVEDRVYSAFVSPKKLAGKAKSHQLDDELSDDIYSTGCLIFQLINGVS